MENGAFREDDVLTPASTRKRDSTKFWLTMIYNYDRLRPRIPHGRGHGGRPASPLSQDRQCPSDYLHNWLARGPSDTVDRRFGPRGSTWIGKRLDPKLAIPAGPARAPGLPSMERRLMVLLPALAGILITAIVSIVAATLNESRQEALDAAHTTTRNLSRVLQEQTERTLRVIDARLSSVTLLWSQVDLRRTRSPDEMHRLLRDRAGASGLHPGHHIIDPAGQMIYPPHRVPDPDAELRRPRVFPGSIPSAMPACS